MPGRMYRASSRGAGWRRRCCSRAVEDSGTVTSPLVPWNSCGAYMSGVLGVATAAYLPVLLLQHRSARSSTSSYGFIGFKRDRAVDRRRPAPSRRERRRRRRSPPAAPKRRRRTRHERRRPASRPRRQTGEASGASQLPSAYTILFALIVLTAIATWIIPAGTLRPRQGGRADPGHVPRGRVATRSGSSSTRSRRRSTACTGSRTPRRATSTSTTRATLFGAIDVALFIIVIGGFLGVTMKTGRDPGRASAGSSSGCKGRERWMIPILMTVFAHRRHDVRDGRGEPRLLRARHHGDDRRRATTRSPGAAIVLLGCGIGVLGSTINPFATGHRLGLRRRPDQRRARRPARHPGRRASRSASSS